MIDLKIHTNFSHFSTVQVARIFMRQYPYFDVFSSPLSLSPTRALQIERTHPRAPPSRPFQHATTGLAGCTLKVLTSNEARETGRLLLHLFFPKPVVAPLPCIALGSCSSEGCLYSELSRGGGTLVVVGEDWRR
uniref:Uncharacterized protein n=1 Tax=Oryza sativa subsp. japonica TaxID=39947 RepID=Q5Z5T7_ORYSJ|nr:hypothetical protein [Oryza sativa Japonica Group]